MKRPASQFYWGDWLNCRELRACSLAARGLWIDMLAFMRQGHQPGHLTHTDGRPVTAEQLARMVGDSVESVTALLQELESVGVPGRTGDGAYFSRRMVRDEAAYQAYLLEQSEAGKRGAARRWPTGRKSGVAHVDPMGDPTKKAWGNHSSSSSSSSSSSKEKIARLTAWFDSDFWPVYPRREAKKDALSAWVKLDPDEALKDRIVAGAKAYARSQAETDPKMIKLPGGWLRGERWKDCEGGAAASVPVSVPRPTPYADVVADFSRQGAA